MEKYVCLVCGYVYDPEEGDSDNGVAAGTAFADIPDDWTCPVCGVEKDQFEPEQIVPIHHGWTQDNAKKGWIMSGESIIQKCRQCGTQNRVPKSRMGETPVCGK